LTENIIVGFGNVLLTDEGIGVHIINSIKKQDLFPKTQYLDLGTSSFELVNFIDSHVQKLVLIDCLKLDTVEPGQVVRLSTKDILSDTVYKISLHQMKLIDTLKLISIDYNLPEMLIIGIIPYDTHSYSTNISANLEKQYSLILKTVEKNIFEFIKNNK